jgi:hypothetical protein
MRLSFIDVARPLEPEDRLKTNSTGESERYEVILALPQGRGALFPYSEFKSFGLSLGFEVYDKNRMVLHDVVSIIVMGPRKKLPLLAEFTLIRDIAESAAQKPLPAPGELY